MNYSNLFLSIAFETYNANPNNPEIRYCLCSIYQLTLDNSLELTKEYLIDIEQSTSEHKQLFYDNIDTPLLNKFIFANTFQKEFDVEKYIGNEKTKIIKMNITKMTEILNQVVSSCKYIIMHNAYDWGVPILNQLKVSLETNTIIDTLIHIPLSNRIKQRDLPTLCAQHNFLLYGERDNFLAPKLRVQCVNEALKTLINLYGVDTILQEVYKQRCWLISEGEDINNLHTELKAWGFVYNKYRGYFEKLVDEEEFNKITSYFGLQIFKAIEYKYNNNNHNYH